MVQAFVPKGLNGILKNVPVPVVIQVKIKLNVRKRKKQADFKNFCPLLNYGRGT